ncbi:Uncharacterised protein [Neisseria gonorrhoeae]|uniref:Uncharacterized protein n=1 Tax=Neisseria gonorrhoeae TaxID=485 RepID=A0A378W404_NEIGO|nr:Uncharacterised protein [Neisseria gonorrhoeae]
MAFDLGYADFDGDAVALEAVEVGLYGRAGIMPVLFERLLEVEQQVEVVGRARLEARQAGDGLFGVTLCAGDFKVAEGNGRPLSTTTFKSAVAVSGLTAARVLPSLASG